MPKPRNIITSNREDKLEAITDIIARQAEKLDLIIDDLSKDHVDDKRAARSLLAQAKKLRKKLPS